MKGLKFNAVKICRGFSSNQLKVKIVVNDFQTHFCVLAGLSLPNLIVIKT